MAQAEVERIPIIDSDVHTVLTALDAGLQARLPKRWREYVELVGFRASVMPAMETPQTRPQAARKDSWPDGGSPGSNPDFARAQLLDRYDESGAVLNEINAFVCGGSRRYPDELALHVARAFNDRRAETWLSHDPRWYGAMNLAFEVPGAEQEIARLKESEFGDRWVMILLPPNNDKPMGHQKYWPIYEVAEHYNLPVGFHILGTGGATPMGAPNSYFALHMDFGLHNFWLVPSMIFEGVFERFPKLKIGLIELAWSWAMSYAWRLDSAYEVMRAEVPHLSKKPSEYMAEHFWYTTQPAEEPEEMQYLEDVIQQLYDTVGEKLMYASDYPHWDFDEPEFGVPPALPMDMRRKILGETAHEFFGGLIPLRENSGLTVELAAR
jgi:predicted TIM-barrel fold metal-dependent hydrolase